MIDRSDYGIATLAMLYGWGASYIFAAWFALPVWLRSIFQALFTIGLGIGALTAQHFWRQYLNRRWPDQGNRESEK